jgi:hypothetical protein
MQVNSVQLSVKMEVSTVPDYYMGWVASPVAAAQIVNVVVLDENPDEVGHYTAIPQFAGIATQTGPHSPNGALTFISPFNMPLTNASYGVLVWYAE